MSSPTAATLKRAALSASLSNPHSIREIVDKLTAIGPGDGLMASCYLKLEPRDRSRGKYAIKLKNRIKARLDWIDGHLDLDRAERIAVEKDLQQIREYLEAPTNLPEGQGIAVFASNKRALFETVPLPRVFRSRVAVDRGPLVRELIALDDEFGTTLCVVYDRTVARFFTVTAFGAEEGIVLEAEDAEPTKKFRARRTRPVPTSGLAMPGEHNYRQRIREEKHRHYAHIAQRLFAMSRATPVRGVVLASVGGSAGAVESHLHRYVRQHVIGTARLNPKDCSPSRVFREVLSVRETKEREWEAEHVKQLDEGLGTRWAVNGVEASLTVLSRGQVRTLLVDPAASLPGYRCSDSGRLTTLVDGCNGEGDALSVPDVIEEAIEEALQQGSQIDVIGGDSSRVEGLAALLRFPRK